MGVDTDVRDAVVRDGGMGSEKRDLNGVLPVPVHPVVGSPF